MSENLSQISENLSQIIIELKTIEKLLQESLFNRLFC